MLIRPENRAFRKRFANRKNLKTTLKILFVFVWTSGKILKTELFDNDGDRIITWFP